MTIRFLCVLFIVALHLQHFETEAQAQAGTTRAECFASCGTTDDPVCGSNGVSYANNCKFDCAKQRNKRLRIVQQGKCTNLTLNDYRKGQKKPN